MASDVSESDEEASAADSLLEGPSDGVPRPWGLQPPPGYQDAGWGMRPGPEEDAAGVMEMLSQALRRSGGGTVALVGPQVRKPA